jgi:hypothetical protein
VTFAPETTRPMKKPREACYHDDVLNGRCLHCGKDLGDWIQQQVYREVARARRKRNKASA